MRPIRCQGCGRLYDLFAEPEIEVEVQKVEMKRRQGASRPLEVYDDPYFEPGGEGAA